MRLRELSGTTVTMIASLLLASTLMFSVPARISDNDWKKEIVYQIFPRSYFDSNGDHVGDLKGISHKLGYLHDLGITAILINPVFRAREYHNYFADDFFSVDPSLGTNLDFFTLVRRAHSMHMKVLLDMEVQYVADGHPWLAQTLKNPASPFSDFVWTKGSAFFGLNINWWPGRKVEVAAINPDNEKVKEYVKSIFRYWAVPNGHASSGVDGFRIDHMMDDLDSKHVKKNMLSEFWLPIVQDIRNLKPNAYFLAEQADWGNGSDCLTKADVDAVFAFPLYFAFQSLQKDKLTKASEDIIKQAKSEKNQFTFIENHDVQRYASSVKSNPALLRLGAVFNLTCFGVPILYYGQELGMKGTQGKWNSDGNDIPVRLAYRWTRLVNGTGSANFYRNTGPWDRTGDQKDKDGISAQEESLSKGSLLNFYRKLIQMRRSEPALQSGSLAIAEVANPNVFGYWRSLTNRSILVLLNLSDKPQTVNVITTKGKTTLRKNHSSSIVLHPYGFKITGMQ